MDIGPPLVACRESAHLVQPGKGSLDNPAMSSQPLRVFDATSSDARLNAASPTGSATTWKIVRLVRMKLFGSLSGTAWPTRNRCHRIQQGCQRHAVMHVGA